MLLDSDANVITANMDDTVVEAAKKIVEREVDSLPVVKRLLQH